jgi:hypothetical protein
MLSIAHAWVVLQNMSITSQTGADKQGVELKIVIEFGNGTLSFPLCMASRCIDNAVLHWFHDGSTQWLSTTNL